MIGENLNDEFNLGFWISDDSKEVNNSKPKKIDVKMISQEITAYADEELEGETFIELKSRLFSIQEFYEKMAGDKGFFGELSITNTHL